MTDAKTQSLAEFLSARYDEDEAGARAAIGSAAFTKQTGRWSFEKVSGQYGETPIVFAVTKALAKKDHLTTISSLKPYAKDLTLLVPPGTVIIDAVAGHVIRDLVRSGDRVVAAIGGRGGKGNLHYKSSTNRAPRDNLAFARLSPNRNLGGHNG